MPVQDSRVCRRLEVMMGRQQNRGIFGTARAEGPLPQARVVVGKHAPDWASAPARPALEGHAVSYVRASAPASATLLAVLNGFWPVIVIVCMGLALLWSGALANSP